MEVFCLGKVNRFQMREELILSTAEDLIKEKGYHHFKMSDISDELGIAKGTIYNHYASKEELLFAVVYPKLVKLKENLQEIIDGDQAYEMKFRNFISNLLNSEYHEFLLMSFSDMSILFQEENQLEMVTIQDEIINCFDQLLLLGIRLQKIVGDYNLHFMSHQMLSILNPLEHSLLVRNSNDMNEEEFLNQTIEVLLYGIANEDSYGGKDLYEIALKTIGVQKLKEHGKAGHVASALITDRGTVYTGICIDLPCSIGFCAEQAAIADMLKHGETIISKIVAVYEDGSIIAPCGRCREFMAQVDEANLQTVVMLSGGREKRLEELLPERWDKKWN